MYVPVQCGDRLGQRDPCTGLLQASRRRQEWIGHSYTVVEKSVLWGRDRQTDRGRGSFLVGRGISEEVKAVESRLRWVTCLGLDCCRAHA